MSSEQQSVVEVNEEVKSPVNPAIIEEVNQFDSKNLKHADVNEKVILPTKEVIEQEKKHLDLVNGLENFDKNKLRPATTQEKIVLPDRESKQQKFPIIT